jgi:anti-sigma B factor antagonist
MTPVGEVRLERHDRVLVAHVVEELDLSNVNDARDAIAAAVTPDMSGAVLDLSETTYIDSTGIRMIFDLIRSLQARSQQLRLVVHDEAIVRRIVVLTKLDETVPIDPDVRSAIAALTGEEARDD